MPWEEQVIDALKANGVDYVAYLPDSALWPLIRSIDADDFFDVYLVSREEEAVGVLSGAWLGGRKGALICQTSGLANTFNALAGVNKAWRIPFVGIVSRRGSIGEHNLAQSPAGYAMPRLLDDIGIRNYLVDASDDIEQIVEMSVQTAFSTEEPHIMLLEKTLFGGK